MVWVMRHYDSCDPIILSVPESAEVALDGFSGHGHCVPGTYGVEAGELQPLGQTPTQTNTSKFSGLQVQLGMFGCLSCDCGSQQTLLSGSRPMAIMLGTGLTVALCSTTAAADRRHRLGVLGALRVEWEPLAWIVLDVVCGSTP